LTWIANLLISGRKKIEKPPLFFPILAWLGIGLFSLLTNWLFMNIEISRGFFYFLKEIEFFFLYFYLFYHLKNIDSAKFIIKIWIFLGLVNVGWVIYQLCKGIIGYYGPGAIGEPEGPFPSGGFFLIIFIFLFNILLYYYFKLNISKLKKAILLAFTVSLTLGVFASGSRASGIGLLFAGFLTILFYFLKEKKKLKVFFITILVFIIFATVFIFFLTKIPAAKRLIGLEAFFWELSAKDSSTRFSIWKTQTLEAFKHPLFLFFGYGKSAALVYEESHSQYVRNLVETGFIGSIVFLFLIFVIIKKSFKGFLFKKNPFIIGLSSGLFVATLTMLLISIPAEAFIVVKIAETYWFFAAITMAVLASKKQENVVSVSPK